ncbi:MAG: hypothetical protein WCY93_11335 [Anaerolineaceae bacterium]
MGTRHLIAAYIDGECKLAQYGQWDGYPAGQGKDIAEFIDNHRSDMEKFKKHLRGCEFIEDESELNSLDHRNPVYSRNTSAGILRIILNEGPQRLVDDEEFASDSLMCEWAYVLDFDLEILEVYRGFNKEQPRGRYAHLKKVQYSDDVPEYLPVTLDKIIRLADLTPDNLINLTRDIVEEYYV